MKIVIVAFLLMVGIGGPFALFSAGTRTVITLDPEVKVIGLATPVHIHMENQHTLRNLTVSLEQDGKASLVHTASKPATRLVFRNGETHPVDVNLSLGKEKTTALHDGKAKLVVTAISNDFRGESVSKTFDFEVMTTPPRVEADGVQHYINQGGSEMAAFTPSGAWTDAGVRVGNRSFRSYPLPDHPGQFFSLFAFSWDLPVDSPVSVFASNPSGAVAKTSFWYKVFPKKFRTSTIALESMNIERIVGQIDTQNKITGTTVERFVHINNEMRKVNNQKLAELGLTSEPKFLWTGAFLPMVDSTVESRFADDRIYTWQGKKVDEQTHLGFDLAKLAHSPIPASNDGKVLWAEDLGIYGNCVVIDHGYGLLSVYGHMSEFLVKKGDAVTKAQIIGKTGSTGLAGGDHLHFTMMLDGVQINPVEWWDPHWVKDRILSKIGKEPTAEPADTAVAVSPAPARKAKKRKR